jgi:hypothetical protein
MNSMNSGNCQWHTNHTLSYVLSYVDASTECHFYNLSEHSGNSYLMHGEQHTEETGANIN